MSTPHAYALLHMLQVGGPLTIGELSTALSIDRTNVSRLCARLTAAGEVERATHPSDGRAVVLQLTKKGRRLARSVDDSSAQRFCALAAQLGGAERHVVDALEYLADIMKKETP